MFPICKGLTNRGIFSNPAQQNYRFIENFESLVAFKSLLSIKSLESFFEMIFKYKGTIWIAY